MDTHTAVVISQSAAVSARTPPAAIVLYSSTTAAAYDNYHPTTTNSATAADRMYVSQHDGNGAGHLFFCSESKQFNHKSSITAVFTGVRLVGYHWLSTDSNGSVHFYASVAATNACLPRIGRAPPTE